MAINNTTKDDTTSLFSHTRDPWNHIYDNDVIKERVIVYLLTCENCTASALQISKYVFGESATTKMINPHLSKMSQLQRVDDSPAMWKIK
jgi:hypothetical protein